MALDALAREVRRLHNRVERLRGLCKSASGWLLDANDIEHSETMLQLVGDMELPLAEIVAGGKVMEFDEWWDSDVSRKHYHPTNSARAAWAASAAQSDAEIERLRADRDCEKRLRKDSDDRATDLAELLTKEFGSGWEDFDAAHRRGQQREIEKLRAALVDCRHAAGLFASVIKSGERWSPECEAAFAKAIDGNKVTFEQVPT